MELKKRLEGDLKAAMKSKDMVSAGTIRMVLAAVHNREIENRSAGKLEAFNSLDDAGVAKILATLSKQHQESIEMFKKGSRNDLAEKEEKELAVVQKYLPSQLSDDEIKKFVLEAISNSGASGTAAMGAVMKILMPKIAGRADGKRVNEIVRQCLTNQS